MPLGNEPSWKAEHLKQREQARQKALEQSRFRQEKKLPMHPRRVRGGLKLKLREGEVPASWVTQRISRVIERAASGEALREGLEYARLGQTKRLTIEDGVVEAVVQGRADKPYVVTLKIAHFGPKDRERIVAAMTEHAVYAAKLLAGEVPPNIEDVFAPLGLKLFPTEPSDFEITSSQKDFDPADPWTKHAVCAAWLLAERLGEEPFLIFNLRGFAGDDLVESLRERRVISGGGPGPSPVYVSHVPGASDAAVPPLEECLDRFWECGPEIDRVDTPIEPPPVRCPLLRRLGPSPFEGRFPMLGLLETCYNVISERAVAEAEVAVNAEAGSDEATANGEADEEE